MIRLKHVNDRESVTSMIQVPSIQISGKYRCKNVRDQMFFFFNLELILHIKITY